MSISIKKLEETNINYEDLFALVKEVFKKREEEGVHVSYNDFSFDDFKSHIEDAIVIVAVDEEFEKPVGMGSIRLLRKQGKLREYGYGELLAVSNTVQRQGVGGKIIQAEKKAAEEMGLSYIRSDTSVKAISSVKFHTKHGYIIDGYQSSGLTNTYSYTYRLPIKKSIKVSFLYCKIRFLLTYVIIRLSKDANGNYSLLGRLFRRIGLIS